MDNKHVHIHIVDKRGWQGTLRNLLAVFILCAPIYIGIVTGSSAMQWMGFVLGCLLFLVLVIEYGKNTKYDSIDEAIQVLERMKREKF